MLSNSEISEILNNSPSINILKLRNREVVILFLINTFSDQKRIISSENIHAQLADYLEFKQVENDEDTSVELFDTYEVKAKKYIQNWTNSGFLTNYQDEKGEIYYELSSHTNKTIDWLNSLKKDEFVGAESKFKNIFNQLKELVEFTSDNIEKRVQLLENKKLEIEQQIQKIKLGEDVKVFEDFEIVPRFNQITQSAKELLSDFKEVEDNFKEITKEIYKKHADGTLTKSDILEFTFIALDELKDSPQGKSFYAFWSFLLNPELQLQWESLTKDLYETLEEKEIAVNDFFLKGMKKHLHSSGQKVYKANDKMAEKLSRIIRENEASKIELTRSVIQDIKKTLIDVSKTNSKPDISFELETEMEIDILFDRKLTFEQNEELAYSDKPQLADEDISQSTQINRLFKQSNIDKDLLRKRIKEALNDKTQTTVYDVIESYGGVEKGLAEIFGYLGIVKEFKYIVNPNKMDAIVFNKKDKKSIRVPEIILTK